MAVPKKKKSKKKKCIRSTTWKQKVQNWKTKALHVGFQIIKNSI
uniref:50S ribosomal protein L32 n=1 Tax=Codium fragile TaxID=3133 RepID=A0A6B9PI05_CODFR|nr:50S ribosomal protein L32 [Codium fragile]